MATPDPDSFAESGVDIKAARALIAQAEKSTTQPLSWQKRWCAEGKEQKKVAWAAALLFVEERDERLGFTDKKKPLK